MKGKKPLKLKPLAQNKAECSLIVKLQRILSRKQQCKVNIKFLKRCIQEIGNVMHNCAESFCLTVSTFLQSAFII